MFWVCEFFVTTKGQNKRGQVGNKKQEGRGRIADLSPFAEKKEILLIRSYRYLTRSAAWEVPAGRREKTETVLQAAKREVVEETGYETTHHRLIHSYHPIIGISSLTSHIVLCKAGKNAGYFDRNEVQEFAWFTGSAIKRMVRKNLIRDGFTLMALLLRLAHL